MTICAEHGSEAAVWDSMLNHASSATRGGVIGSYKRATLIEPMRKVMALWDRLLSEELELEAPGGAVADQRGWWCRWRMRGGSPTGGLLARLRAAVRGL